MKDLARWPLLAAGLTVLAVDIGLIADGADKRTAIALLFGVGSVMVGAGIAHVLGKDGDE